MTNKKTLFLYGGIFAAAVCFFGYTLFPEEKVRAHILISFSEIFPKTELQMQKLKPLPPVGARLKDVRLLFAENRSLDLDAVSVGYGLLASLGAERSFSVNADAYDGSIKGILNVNKATPEQMKADFRLADIRLEKIKILQEWIPDRLIGLLKGSIIHNGSAETDKTLLDLELTDCRIPVKISFLDLGLMDFSRVHLDAALNMENMDIRKCTLKGNQADGELSGRIAFAETLGRSRLDLSGTLNLHHEFLKTLPKNLVSGIIPTRNGIPFTISGSFEKPNFFLR